MSETWMEQECLKQAILYLSHESRAGADEETAGMPEPLLNRDSAILARLRAEAGDARGSHADVKSLVQVVKDLFPTDQSKTMELPEAWNYAALIGWWLKAGEALRTWNPAYAKQYERLLSPASSGLYPPFWCAARFERLCFSFDSWRQSALTAAGPGPDWRGGGKVRRDYRLKLLKWVMNNRRPRPGRPDPARQSQEWLQSLKHEFGEVFQDAVDMLGSECAIESGGPLTHETARDWIPIWHAGQFPGGLVQEVRQPVMQSGGDRATLVKGIAVLPPASFMCRRLHSATVNEGVAIGGWATAIQFAAGCWGAVNPADPAAIPLPLNAWKRQGESDVVIATPGDLDAGLSAVARLLVIATAGQGDKPVETHADDPGRAEREALRVALAFEGFSMRTAPAPGELRARAIPHGGSSPSAGTQKLTLRVALPNPGGPAGVCEVDVGTLGPPAVCTAPLLAAIEAVDWQLWALDKAPFPEDVSRRKHFVLDPVNQQIWEAVKSPVLTRAGEAEILCLFEYVHRSRLGLEAVIAATEDGIERHLAGSLLDNLDALRLVALAEAVAIDPQAVDRLSPPRQLDGSVHVVKWVRQRLLRESDADETMLVWASCGQSFATATERLDKQGRLVVMVSAGQAGAAEIGFLNAPLPAIGHGTGAEPFGRPLRTVLAEFQGRLIESLAKSPADGLGTELPALRRRFAALDAPAFHELIERARKDDAAAVAWLDLLGSHPRFDFQCHPPLSSDRLRMEPPGIDDEYLAWDDDPDVPPGDDLAVTFAIDPRQARRVISRGPWESGSLNDLTASLITSAQAGGGRFVAAAEACRDATDRRQLFGEAAAHPVTKAGPLLDAILAAHDLDARVRQVIFAAVCQWCAALGHDVLPAEWRAGEPLPAAQFTELDLAPSFDESVPAGTCTLKCFGLRGPHGVPLEAAVSAGPAPPGFIELRAALGELVNTPDLGHTAKLADAGSRLNELAKQAANGRLPMVVPNLFDSLWGAAEAAPAHLQAAFEPAKSHLLQLLKSSCRMVVFEPVKMTDYPSEWTVGPDGKRASGNRIRKVLRPGVRTLSSTLVRPAIVETE